MDRWASTSLLVRRVATNTKKYVSYLSSTLRTLLIRFVPLLYASYTLPPSLVSYSVTFWIWWVATYYQFLCIRTLTVYTMPIYRTQIHRCTRKQCTPGDREYVKRVRFVPPKYVPYQALTFMSVYCVAHAIQNLPVVLTKLEIKMPMGWCTSVMHLFMCETLPTLEDCGTHESIFVDYMQTTVRSVLTKYDSYPPTLMYRSFLLCEHARHREVSDGLQIYGERDTQRHGVHTESLPDA